MPNPTADAVQAILLRELRALARQVDAYPDEDSLWRTVPGIANSGGTLALHLAGNLQHFIGAVLCGTGYVRDRDAEFSRRVERERLLAEIAAASRAVERLSASVGATRLDADYPVPIGGRSVHTSVFLLHLVSHLAYHLGQVDYHRRITTGDRRTADSVPVSELPGLDAG